MDWRKGRNNKSLKKESHFENRFCLENGTLGWNLFSVLVSFAQYILRFFCYQEIMSIGTQVTDAATKLSNRHYEDAVIATSVALSATARLEYPTDGDKLACHNFLKQMLPIICKIGWVSFGISQPINFKYRRLDTKAPGLSVRTMPEMLYDVVRCTALHEAGLPSNLQFTDNPVIQLGLDGELVLPIDVIYGLLIAIVASPKNANERAKGNATFSFGGKSIPLNELWGKLNKIEAFIGIK